MRLVSTPASNATTLAQHLGSRDATIGQLCVGADCDKHVARIGKLRFAVMTSGIDPIRFRPQTDVSDDDKIRIVGRLRELGSNDARAYLAAVGERWPKQGSPRVKQAIDSAVKASPGGKRGQGESDVQTIEHPRRGAACQLRW